MKAVKIVGIQYAALPFRLEARQVQILLITSRETRRWVIPKGWPIIGMKPHEVAAVEAAEEAGLAGEVADQPIGSYRYLKRLKGERTTAVQVIVFPFRAEAHAEAWKEQGQRSHAWFRYAKAARLVAEPGLGRLIRELGLARSPGFLARSLRTYRSWRGVIRARPSLG
ncbi:MAG TPA: NUDIX domain-containing protein [Caulobacteraceae bacterium]|jgi:ADP-ribose pyrophosphatase YjhB (NUDIX family)|nr:NUDIX domain-containing protein [Caulobacteraceae bacterium]